MNVRNNKRRKESQEKIEKAFIGLLQTREIKDITVSDIIKEKYGAETKLITNVGTVIGAHAGPGTIALFFVGKER